ncbi:XRE family transcriptional regulator [Rhizobium johnstonii]
MGRSLDEVIASLPRDQQEQIEARYDELRQDVEGLRELRQIAGKGQADIASALNIKQPSVSKIEKQTDMYLSTLRSYVEAVGGKLELTVKLPKRPALRIQHLGDHTAAAVAKPRVAGRGATSPARRHHG